MKKEYSSEAEKYFVVYMKFYFLFLLLNFPLIFLNNGYLTTEYLGISMKVGAIFYLPMVIKTIYIDIIKEKLPAGIMTIIILGYLMIAIALPAFGVLPLINRYVGPQIIKNVEGKVFKIKKTRLSKSGTTIYSVDITDNKNCDYYNVEIEKNEYESVKENDICKVKIGKGFFNIEYNIAYSLSDR